MWGIFPLSVHPVLYSGNCGIIRLFTYPSTYQPIPSLTMSAADPKSGESHSLMVMDMGQHVVQDLAQPLTLHQVLVPGLEDRARAFPPVSTVQQLSPGILPGLCSVPPALYVCSSLCNERRVVSQPGLQICR